MNKARIARLRGLALLLLLPGLAGLILSVTLSTHYMNTLPRFAVPDEQRTVPRDINGYTVYQTPDEDRRLDVVEYASVTIFLFGLGVGLLYLHNWGLARAVEDEDDELLSEEG